jgi:4-carboxymuconolactone decarboxylase
MTRDELRRRGEEMRARLGVDASEATVPGFADFTAEAVYGGVWARPGLPLWDRMVCTLSALCVLERPAELKPMVAAALEMGLTPRNILEVFMQSGLYAGFGTTQTASAVARGVFDAKGVSVPDEPQRNDDNETVDARGRKLMAEIHGERGRQGYAAPDNPITGALFTAAVRYGYGELWFRPGLDNRQRMLCALASFTVMSLEGQLRKFSQSALNVGLTRDEIVEAIIQTGPYGGFPRALNGLAILSEVF